MKKMNIRQAFAKMKKMFPRSYVSVKREFQRFSSERDATEFCVYTDRPIATLAKSGNSFEEAIKNLKEKINEIQTG